MAKTLKLIPLGHRILVKPDDIKEEIDWGDGIKFEIVKGDPKLHRAAQDRGVIVAIGPKAWEAYRTVENGELVNGKPWAKVGDHVWFARNCGYHVQHPHTKERFILMNDDDIAINLQEVDE